MWTTKLSPTAATGSPVASISMPVLSMATCPWGSHRTRKTADGSASISRWTSSRSAAAGSAVTRSSVTRSSSHEPAGASGPGPAADARAAAKPVLPAGGVPVPALLHADAPGHPGAVGGPGHHVRGARHDLLVAPGAAVRLGRPRAGDAADHPVAVRPRLGALGPGHGFGRT